MAAPRCLLLGLLVSALLATALCQNSTATKAVDKPKGAAPAAEAKAAPAAATAAAAAAATTAAVPKASPKAVAKASVVTTAKSALAAATAAVEAASAAVEAANDKGVAEKEDAASAKPADKAAAAVDKKEDKKAAPAADAKPGDKVLEGKNAAEIAAKPSEASAQAADTPVKAGGVSKSAAAAANPAKKVRTKAQAFVNKVVEFAPAANVTFGDDIDDEGKCAKEIEKYCDDEDEGNGKLADCLSEQITESEVQDDNADVPVISDACREEVYQFKISRNSNINRNIPLAKACKIDADKFCNVTWFFGYKSGQVISCLRDVKGQVSKPCKQQLFKIMMDAAVDIRADPMLYESCKEDTQNLCKDVKNGGGRIQACLRDKRVSLSWACEEQLFRQEMENADDIRLSVRLFSKCLPDKRKYCKDIAPGMARTKDCLEENRDELSSGCKEEIDTMIERRVRDFRLDSRLRQSCENEIFNMCAYFGDLDDIDTYDSSVINCLQDYSAEIKSGECKNQVKKYVQLAAQDIRFDVPLAEACYEDRLKYCGEVPPGSARVIRCLMNSRDKLSPVCRATLFDEEVRFSENIDFQYPMKSACSKEMERFCKDIPHGNARVIRCLQDNKAQKDFGKACIAEIKSYEETITSDYRLNHRLHKACQKEVEKLCPGLCQANDGSVCGGKVLRCLTDKVEDVTDAGCKKEVFYFEKMEVHNFKNDIILAEACRSDVDQFCANVEGGEGRVHKCLRDNRKKLSDACRKEELLLETKESSNIELSVSLMKSCSAERQLYCREVTPGAARVFRCLAENMNDADFGNTCKFQITQKLQRRQSNWKLDPPLRKACRGDVMSMCANEDMKDSEDGLVYKCLIKGYSSISSGCQKELGRAVHMAFYVWQPGSIITQECDDDIQRLCLEERPNMAQRPGAVGSCLADLLEKLDRSGSSRRSVAEAPSSAKAVTPGTLGDKCFVLADIAEPPNMKKAFESSLSFALLKDQLEKIEGYTGIPTIKRTKGGDAQGVSLTGWMALLGMSAMIVLVIYASFAGYKRFRGGPDSDYTLVVKQGGGKGRK